MASRVIFAVSTAFALFATFECLPVDDDAVVSLMATTARDAKPVSTEQ